MENLLDFETALEILKSDIFTDDCSYSGALLFVSQAFDISIDTLLEKIEQ